MNEDESEEDETRMPKSLEKNGAKELVMLEEEKEDREENERQEGKINEKGEVEQEARENHEDKVKDEEEIGENKGEDIKV